MWNRKRNILLLRGGVALSRRRFAFEAFESRQLLAGIEISEFMAINDGTLLDGNGESSDWIELLNASESSVDLEGYHLSDDESNPTKWKFPSVTLDRGAVLVVFASSPQDDNGENIDDYVDQEGNLHTNFKLSGAGEYLGLISPDGETVVDEFAPYPAQRSDVSYGQQAFFGTRQFYTNPTPGAANEGGVIGFVDAPTFSADRGFYSEPLELAIAAPTDAFLVYTTDGSVPTETNGTKIDTPDGSVAVANVNVATTTVVRAAAFRLGYAASDIETHSYLFTGQTIQQPARIDGIPSNVDLEFDPDIANDPRFNDEIDHALRSIPTMSLVLNHDDLFGRRGIYTNPLGRGIEWERAASIELILPDGTTGFQEDAGLRIFGATTRNLPKKPFRLSFRSEYGAKKLEYPLFPDSPAEAFDNIVLRAQQTNSWQRPGRTLDTEQADFLEDTWARDAAKAMGKLDGHSTFVHLYLNGLYWGVYNPVERPDSSFGEEYLGGDEDDYDAINRRPVQFNGEGTVAIDGNLDAWREMMRLAEADLSVAENYEAIQAYVSIDNVIQQFLLHQYMGHLDGPGNGHLYNNMRLIRKRAPNEPFYAFAWDMEYSFVDVNQKVNIDFPATPDTMSVVYDTLRANPEFVTRYGDLAHRYLFNDGALTPEQAASRYDERAAVIESAIIGETARWGDLLRNHLRPGEPFNRDDEWTTERERMLNEYFPQRAGVLVSQLRDSGLYPQIDAPRFLVAGEYQHGGHVQTDAQLTFTQELQSPFTFHELTNVETAYNVYVPSGEDFADDLSWTETSFDVDDVANPWGANGGLQGSGGIGFDSGNGRYDDLITTDVGAELAEKDSTSVFIRQEFSIQNDFEHLQLDIAYDDGFVAYINGQEVARSNVGDISPPSSVRATTGRESTDDESFRIDLSNVSLVSDGPNVLAIHVVNRSASNNDLLVVPNLLGATIAEGELIDEVYFTLDGSDPRASGGQIAGSRFDGGIRLEQDVTVKARSFRDGQWSALTEALFSVGPLEGDFDTDSKVDSQDIDLLFAAMRSPQPELSFDLTDDAKVNEDDRNHLIQTVMQTSFGDANLDGVFDSTDLVQIFAEAKFAPTAANGAEFASWSQGDWDGDGVFGTSDLVLAFQLGKFER